MKNCMTCDKNPNEKMFGFGYEPEQKLAQAGIRTRMKICLAWDMNLNEKYYALGVEPE